MMSGKELEKVVGKMLTEGVPPGVVARVFDLDINLIKKAQREMRVSHYGTDDLNDYLEQMNWAAVEDALTTLQTGSAVEKARVRSSILGKQMTAAVKRNPEGQRDKLAQVTSMFAKMRGDDG